MLGYIVTYFCCLIFYLVELFKESVLTTFDNEWDVVPAGRVKVVHSNGAVCKFEIDIESSKYTGVLKNGRKTGITRMGSATDVSNGAGVVAGMAFKFLRTGARSANFFVMDTLNRINNSNYDFFSVSMSNHIKPSKPPTTTARLARGAGTKKFNQGSVSATKLGLSDLAR